MPRVSDPKGKSEMLIEFIKEHRATLIAQAQEKVAQRLSPTPTKQELTSGVPLFLDQLIQTLQTSPAATLDAMNQGAVAHGAALLTQGYTVGQVVHDYGDICQVITALAQELDAQIDTEEFHVFNRCLDNAIAQAVTEYVRIREESINQGETGRADGVAYQLRNRIAATQLAFQAIQSGRAPIGGSVAAIVTRSLQGMTRLINRGLVEVRLDTGRIVRQRVHLNQFIEEVEVQGMMDAGVRGVSLIVASTDRRGIDIDVDSEILAGAVANLLQNALRFTRAGGTVSLRTSVSDGGRVAIEIEDQCGGFPPGKADELLSALQQKGLPRNGLGLGLFNSRKGIEANGGLLGVRDLPGSGCIFSIDLPRLPGAPLRAVD